MHISKKTKQKTNMESATVNIYVYIFLNPHPLSLMVFLQIFSAHKVTVL